MGRQVRSWLLNGRRTRVDSDCGDEAAPGPCPGAVAGFAGTRSLAQPVTGPFSTPSGGERVCKVSGLEPWLHVMNKIRIYARGTLKYAL